MTPIERALVGAVWLAASAVEPSVMAERTRVVRALAERLENE